MGRASEDEGRLTETPTLWPEHELLSREMRLGPSVPVFLGNDPVWTKHKAELIRGYLRLFLFVTHHGCYIDGFAAPQKLGHVDKWTAKLVLEMEPNWFDEFWLCDLSVANGHFLDELHESHHSSTSPVHVLHGDFNTLVNEVLGAGTITNKTATFALLDQRTFECNWSTLELLARHKTTNKIELFYFLATGWLDRAMRAVSTTSSLAQMERWWGKADMSDLKQYRGHARAEKVAARFKDELGYRFVNPYPIYSRPQKGRVMYHMIHATDHPEAPRLMARAYRKVSRRSQPAIQIDLEEFIKGLDSVLS